MTEEGENGEVQKAREYELCMFYWPTDLAYYCFAFLR